MVLGRFLVAVMTFQDKFASLWKNTVPLAEISLKYVKLTFSNCVKTCKRRQAAHLHRRESFENLLHKAPLSRTLSGILQFEI